MMWASRVKQVSRALGLLLGGAVGASTLASPPPLPAILVPQSTVPTQLVRPNLLDAVNPEFRDAVAKCMAKATVSTAQGR